MNENSIRYTENDFVSNEVLTNSPEAEKVENVPIIETKTIPETLNPAIESEQEVKEPKVEKGWFSRSKDSIARGSENFLKKIASGALESFDKNVTSKLMRGPSLQIEKHKEAISKYDKAIIALNELLMNSNEGFSNKKGQDAILKFTQLKAESKAKLETATDRFNVRNKWHESILATRNEFLTNIANNYKTIEDAKKEQLNPLEEKLDVCEEERENLNARNLERDNDIKICIEKIGNFKNAMISAGFSEVDIMNMPAVKEVQKTMQMIKFAKEFDLEQLNERENRLKKQYSKKHYNYEDILKKRKNIEDLINTAKENEFEAKSEHITEVKNETPVSNKKENNEIVPKFSIKEQVQLWNSLGHNDPSIVLDTVEISAKMFKQENELLTKEDFSKLATTLLLSRGTNQSIIASVSNLLKITA